MASTLSSDFESYETQIACFRIIILSGHDAQAQPLELFGTPTANNDKKRSPEIGRHRRLGWPRLDKADIRHANGVRRLHAQREARGTSEGPSCGQLRILNPAFYQGHGVYRDRCRNRYEGNWKDDKANGWGSKTFLKVGGCALTPSVVVDLAVPDFSLL